MIPLYENRKKDIECRDSRLTGRSIRYSIPHLHYNVEIAFLISGCARAQIDSDSYEVNAGDLVIVFPNQVHSYEPIVRDQHLLAIVSPDLFPEFSRLFKEAVPVSNVIRGGADTEELCELIRKLNGEYFSDSPYRENVMRGYLLCFFGKLFRLMEWKQERSEEITALGAIMNYCIRHFDKECTLEVLEKNLYISRSYISRIVNAGLHMGLNEYVNSIRISNACNLLSTTRKSISEISTLVGFNTLRTFNRAFVKQMNMTPREYQRGRGL